MLLFPIRERLRKKLDKYMIWKAVWDCPPCMASVWGSLFFWGWHIVWPIPAALFLWIPSLVIIAMMNALIWHIYLALRDC